MERVKPILKNLKWYHYVWFFIILFLFDALPVFIGVLTALVAYHLLEDEVDELRCDVLMGRRKNIFEKE